MRKMKIFEPAMCCSTGLCGVSVDPELLRISTVLDTLKKNGVEVARYNLSTAPQEFIANSTVQTFLKTFGTEKLPLILVDDLVVIAGRYPTNEEFVGWLDLNPSLLGVEGYSCCAPDCCC